MIGWMAKTLAVLIMLGIVLTYFPGMLIIAIALFVLYWLIRIGADIYWWRKDNER